MRISQLLNKSRLLIWSLIGQITDLIPSEQAAPLVLTNTTEELALWNLVKWITPGVKNKNLSDDAGGVRITEIHSEG